MQMMKLTTEKRSHDSCLGHAVEGMDRDALIGQRVTDVLRKRASGENLLHHL